MLNFAEEALLLTTNGAIVSNAMLVLRKVSEEKRDQFYNDFLTTGICRLNTVTVVSTEKSYEDWTKVKLKEEITSMAAGLPSDQKKHYTDKLYKLNV